MTFASEEPVSGNPSEVLALSWRSMYLSRAKLKATSRTSALLSGFAMVALVELELGSGQPAAHPALIMTYAVTTALMVSVHLLALMMSTCILPHLDAVSAVHSFNTSPSESPHIRLKWYIDTAWFFSTVLGLLLFLVEIGVVFLLKLRPILAEAGYVTSAILIPVGIIFIIFTVTFYRKLAMHRYEMSKEKLAEIDRIHAQLDLLEKGAGIAPNYGNSFYGGMGGQGGGYSVNGIIGGELAGSEGFGDDKELIPCDIFGGKKNDTEITLLGPGSVPRTVGMPVNNQSSVQLPPSVPNTVVGYPGTRIELERLRNSLVLPPNKLYQQQQQLLQMVNGALVGEGGSPGHYKTPPNSGFASCDISPSFRRLTSGPVGPNATVPICAKPQTVSSSPISSSNECSPNHTNHSGNFFPGV